MRCRILIPLLLCLQCTPAVTDYSEPFGEVRVRIMERHHPRQLVLRDARGTLHLDEETIRCDGCDLIFTLKDGRIICSRKGRKVKSRNAEFTSQSTIRLVVASEGGDRYYSGSLELGVDGNDIRVVNRTSVDDYVAGSARSELGPLMALDEPERKQLILAMETAIRSCIYHSVDRHPGQPWQFCDLTHCFHYRGLRVDESAEGDDRYCLLEADGTPLEAFFHSTCGGVLAPPSVMWPSIRESGMYREGKDRMDGTDDLCSDSPHYGWSACIGPRQMDRILRARNVRKLEAIMEHGRVAALEFDADGCVARQRTPVGEFMSGCGRLLGWNVVKSNLFSVVEKNGRFIFTGRGLGHGTGLCQYGAAGLARGGYPWRQILHFYYPGARIARVAR